MKRAALLSFVTLLGCSGPADAPAEAPTDAVATDGKADSTAAAGTTRLLQLDNAAFTPPAGRPGALVYLPPNFDPTPPLNVIVYIHGFYNCVENIVRPGPVGRGCGGGSRQSYNLAAQLDATGKNALFIAPEVAFDQASSAPGKLGDAGGFRALLDEALGKLGSDVGGDTINDVGQVVVASHSGGYKVAAAIAQKGGLPVSEVLLLDSLYGSTADFDAWVNADLGSFSAAPAVKRFASIYSQTGGTLGNSQAMAGRAAGWFDAGAGVVVDDRTTGTLTDEQFAHGLVFKRTGLPHDGVPRYYFGRLIATSVVL
jgi:hypothetical protein